MKIDSRKIALASGWILTVVLGVVIGRQTSAPTAASEKEAVAARVRAHGGTAAAAGHRDSTAARKERTTKRPRTFADLKHDLHLTLSNADQVDRTRQLLRLIDSLGPDEFQGVIEAFRADGFAKTRGADYALLLHAWVKADPYAAVTYLEETEPSGEARRTALTAWAAADPYAAAAWVDGREDVGGTNDWIVGLLHGIASNDPDLARQTLEGLEAGKTRSAAMEATLPYVLQNGFDFTAAWIASIGDEDLQRGTARHAARDLTRANPEQAGTWISDMASVDSRRDASEEVSDEWARRDLESARRWAESLPEDTRTEAAEGIARQMARQDPERTADWLQSLGDNPDLDGARRIFLSESANQNPQVALENVYTLSSADDQSRMYSQILGRWARNDQDATRLWVLDNADTLPEKVVKHYAKPRN
ncbi:MAG: hypothetical protein O3A92_02935 [Verrucomicrobia bacterium]|nr:hypothetical protein [Verrucomicrobiota bacterium]